MSDKNRQHWVPQFYLRGFRIPGEETDNPLVWACAREGKGDPFTVGVKNIGAKNGLYPEEVDFRLRQIEDLLGGIWPEIAKGYISLDNGGLRKALALFVTTLYLRNPTRIPEYQSIHLKLVRFLDSLPKDEEGRPALSEVEVKGRSYPVDRAGWEEYKRGGDTNHHAVFSSTITEFAQDLARFLLTKRWAIVFDDSARFATSDCPVSLRHPTRQRFGFKTHGTVVSLPLSPTRFLIIDDEPGAQGYFAKQPGFAEAMNYQTWCNLDRFLISRTQTDHVLARIINFVEEHGLD